MTTRQTTPGIRPAETAKHLVLEVPITQLRPYKRNARTHSRKQVTQIADSIREFGFTNPVLIDRENTILAGHGRVEAAKLLGLSTVPTLRIEHMSEAQKRAYVIADNKIALNARWNREILTGELQALRIEVPSFDIGLTGFSIPEVDSLSDGLQPEATANSAEDRLPDSAECPPRCRPGDIWELGRHRLVCGDGLDPDPVGQLMNSELADMVFTDPYAALSPDELAGVGVRGMLRRSFTNLIAHSRDGSIHFVSMDWRHMGDVLAAAEEPYGEPQDLVVWTKDSGGGGAFYRSRHELIIVFANGAASDAKVAPGRGRQQRTNVWRYRAANSTGQDRSGQIARHLGTKPVALIADAINDVSPRGGIVLDLCGGAGSTLIAAHKTGRRAYICERDPLRCNRIIKRWERFANLVAIRIASGPSAAPAANIELQNCLKEAA
ncbi:ParB N-terminal domain-containing protein [Micromonospora sp. STR1s_5]|nr:ParB N-terminal domain-containing protein [Micromonospora sp. STR1s_5]